MTDFETLKTMFKASNMRICESPDQLILWKQHEFDLVFKFKEGKLISCSPERVSDFESLRRMFEQVKLEFKQKPQEDGTVDLIVTDQFNNNIEFSFILDHSLCKIVAGET